MNSVRKRLWAVVPLICAGALAACGSSSNTPAPGGTGTGSVPSGGANAAVAKLVPSSIKSKGTLTVAADAGYAPDESIASDGHTVIGMDADLAKALGAIMGLKVTVVNATFATIIPGLTGGKYDIGASSFTDTKAREKVVDFVDYFSAGESFFTKASGGTSVTGLSGLCGLSVSVESGTVEESDAKAQSAKCTAAGKKPVNVLSYPTQTAANLALNSGRAQLGMADSQIVAYQIKQSNGGLKLTGKSYGFAPYGLAVPKNPALAPAVQAALKALVQNGTYASILQKWGIQSGGIPVSKMKINGATS